MSAAPRRRLLLPEMEGRSAHWYARVRGTPSARAESRREAARLAEGLADGASVLEVAPGPGYLAIEIAQLGQFRVTGLDISRTMVEIASENARETGVNVEFRQGDASEMPYDDACFDLIVCQAAFKNFRQPLSALNQMHRVLRGGGRAVIQDMSRDASNAEIKREVAGMGLSPLNRVMTRLILSTTLRRRSYSPARFRALVAQSAFASCEISTAGIGLEVRLTKGTQR